MRIEITEKSVRHAGHEYLAGPHTVPDSIGVLFCAVGWAKDLDAGVDTGARNTDPVALDVQSVRHATASPEVS